MRRRELIIAAPLAAAVGGLRADEGVWEALRAGGCALLMRHAQTVPGIGDPPGFRLGDCATQRNLSEAGRAQARRLGERLRARGLRIDEVRSSQWCRCLETARLAFPDYAVAPLEALNSFFEDRSTGPQQTAALRRYLAALGARTVALVTHQVNIRALAGEFAAMGEAVVVAPAAGDALRVLGRLRID
jgi:broad specificity phosphatase PhoE